MRGVLLGLVCAGAACAAARGQDSVAPGPAPMGDALDAYQVAGPSEQVNNYAVDLAPIVSSWGGRFAVGPVVKSSRSTGAGGSAGANHLIAAQAASSRFVSGPILRSAYDLWNAAGQGVNSVVNTAPAGTVPTSGLMGQRGAVAFLEFGAGPDGAFGSGDDENNIISAVFDFQFRRPNRLLVSRVVGASNKLTAATGNSATASFGMGGVDASGSVAFLADGFATLSPSRLSGKDYFRVDPLVRDAARVNRIQQAGANDAAATVRVLDTTTALAVPTLIPAATAGRPVLIGTSFASNFVYESAPGVASTTRAYLPGSMGSPRGGVSFTGGLFAPVVSGMGDAGTAMVLTRGAGATRTRGVSVFGVNTDGSVDGQLRLELPTMPGQLVDAADSYDPSVFFPDLPDYEFTNVQSQACFRGGSGQVAGVVLGGGDMLVAALVNLPGPGSTGSPGSAVPQGQYNAIAVARVNAQTGQAQWVIAAHTGDSAGSVGPSKAIRGDYGADGIPGTGDAGEGDRVLDATPIGRLALQSEVSLGSVAGPSMSSPAMDGAGNLYFLACARLNTINGPAFHHVLIRANYDGALGSPGGAGGYTLELLAQAGQVVHGANSTKDYEVSYLGTADADSIDSGAIWSGNIVQGTIAGAPASPPVGSPMTLGVLAVRAKIVYDVDGDGQFVDPEVGGGDDQSYNVVLAVMPRIPAADFNRDGQVNSQDFFDFLSAFFTLGPGADYNGTGSVNSQDYFDFLTDFFNG